MFLLSVLDAGFRRCFQIPSEAVGGSRDVRGHQLTLRFALSCLRLAWSPGL